MSGTVDSRESVNEMSAKKRVDVARRELGLIRPVLGPVGHVADELERVLSLFTPRQVSAFGPNAERIVCKHEKSSQVEDSNLLRKTAHLDELRRRIERE